MVARWEPVLDEVVRERYPRLVARAVLMTGSVAPRGVTSWVLAR